MELKEVDPKSFNDIMFQRIGLDVPVLSETEGFPSDNLPIGGVAVSNRFGYTFFAHSRGFTVAKTAALLDLAKSVKEKAEGFKTAQETGIATVVVPQIRSLALSSDELTISVCAGRNVTFHELAALVHKADTCPFEVRIVDPHDDIYARDFSWSPSNSESYFILTSQGKLLLGNIGSTPECKVEKGVVAASWSADGQHIAYVMENCQLSICTSNFGILFKLELPGHLSDEDKDSDLHVDAIRWVRPDSIIVGYVRVNSEGEEDEYPLFLLNSRNGNLAQDGSKVVGLVFYQFFPSVDSFILPSGSGPYMLADYLKPWEIVVAASRKSVDDHIVLISWIPEDGMDIVYSVELGNELWVPRIELQDNGDDNAILGLAVDCTTVQIQLPDPRDETGDSLLPPSPVLICLTLEGKLSFFTFARLDKKWQLPEFVLPPSDVPDVKRSIRQAFPQLMRTQETSTALVSLGPAVVKGELAKGVPSALELTDQAMALSRREENQDKLNQGGMSNRSRADINDDTVSLFERFTRSSISLPQEVHDHRPSEVKLGFKPVSQDGKKSTNNASSSSALVLKELKGSDIVVDTFQGLFRPFDEGSKITLSVTKSLPPEPHLVPQLPVVSPSVSIASSVPIKSLQNGPAIATATPPSGKNLQTRPDTTPTVALSSSVHGQSGGGVASKVIRNQKASDRFTQGPQSRVFQEQQPSRRAHGVTEMEAAFILELEKVRMMADEVDQLMSYIESGRQMDTHQSHAAFTKQSLEDLERGIQILSEECKTFRRNLHQEKQDIEDLRDETMRVDAWRIYTQSLMEQKNDHRHQELWIHQKLHPELELKRKHVLRADQELKLQITELEGHLHNLELKQWQQDSARRKSNQQIWSPGRFSSLQNLYNTVNTQLAVAEELSNSLAEQMETLNIRWSSPTKSSKNATVSDSRSVGSYSERRDVHSLSQWQRSSYSPLSGGGSITKISTQVPEPSIQETIRRRRDSMDSAWVDRGAPTTTIKRAARSRLNQNITIDNSSRPTFRQGMFGSMESSSKENWPQLRHVWPSQITRMGSTSARLVSPASSVEVLATVTSSGRTGLSSSASQWSSPRSDPNQIKPGLSSFGDPSTSPVGSGFSAINNNSKETLFKWAHDVVEETTPKAAMSIPTSTFSVISTSNRISRGTSDGPEPNLAGIPENVIVTKPKFSGFSDRGTGVNSAFVSSVKATNAADEAAVSVSFSSNSSSRLGTTTGQRVSPVYHTENESNRTGVGIEENQRAGANTGSPAIPHLTISPPTHPLTGSVPMPSVSGPSPTSLVAGASSFSQTIGQEKKPLKRVEVSTLPQVSQQANLSSDSGGIGSRPSVVDSLIAVSAVSGISCPSLAASLSASFSAIPLNESAAPVPPSVAKPLEVSKGDDFLKSPMNMGATLNLGTPDDELPVTASSLGAAQGFSLSTNSGVSTTSSFPLVQSAGSPFTSSSVSAIMKATSQNMPSGPFAQSRLWQQTQQPIQQPTQQPMQQPMQQPTQQPMQQAMQQSMQQPFLFPDSSPSSMISTTTTTILSIPVESNEEDMEEEATAGLGTFGGFGGLGLGISGTVAQTQKSSPFGGSAFTGAQPFQLASPTEGQLFRPATFSLPAAQSSPQQAAGNAFGSGFAFTGFSQNSVFSEAGKGFGSSPQPTSGGFGQRSQLGPGQQALGSALGAFGQTRQVGLGTPFGSGIGSAPVGGFASAPTRGGFAGAAATGGFANAPTGGGFSGAGMGGGFAAAATGGGFAGVAAQGGGFTGVGAGGGFVGLGGGGFQAFAGNQGGSPGFGSGVSPSQTNLFTQMRK